MNGAATIGSLDRGQAGLDDRARSLALYRTIALIRRAEETIVRHYGENEMKTPMHMSMGQEAVPAGICVALGDRVEIVTSYRSHAGYIARTGDVERFFAELYGRQGGTAEGKAGSMHLADPGRGHLCSTAIVAAGLPLAAGAAFANKRLGNGRIVVAMFGDGAGEEGNFWETCNLAALMRLPLVFCCEDNGLAVHTRPDKRRGFAGFSEVARTFRMPYLRFDDNDPETAARLADEARDLIDARPGPVFLHAACYRYLEHVGTNEDFQAGYRDRSEYERWRERDCLDIQRARLISAGLKREVAAIDSVIEARVAAAQAAARDAPFAAPERLFAGVFHAPD